MEYQKYEKKIVIDLSLELVGWTHELFVNPASLPANMADLKKLRDALESSECFFCRISQTERTKRRLAYEQLVEAGQVKQHKVHGDKGKKHKVSTSKDKDSHQTSKCPHVEVSSSESSLESSDGDD